MKWEGSNPNTIIEVTDPTENYYTFGEKGYENVKAKGFKKLTYKNLYPNIDVEYIIPEKGEPTRLKSCLSNSSEI